MRLILEGPDNAGKTSLANRLIGACPHIMYHHPGGKPTTFQDEVDCITEQLKWLDAGNCIVDRITPISQRVYNPEEGADAFRAKMFESYMMMNPVIIYCRPSDDRLMRFQDFTWRDGETEEHKQKIITRQHEFIKRYDEIMRYVPNVAYNFDEPTGEVIFQKAVQAFMGEPGGLRWFRDLMNYRSF